MSFAQNHTSGEQKPYIEVTGKAEKKIIPIKEIINFCFYLTNAETQIRERLLPNDCDSLNWPRRWGCDFRVNRIGHLSGNYAGH